MSMRVDGRLKGQKWIKIRYRLVGIEDVCVGLTMIGTVGPTAFLTALNNPRDGVRPPPFVRFEQSSSLSAPPRTALFDHEKVRPGVVRLLVEGRAPTNAIAESTESTQTSMTNATISTVLLGLYAKIGEITSGDLSFVPS